jgi:predicted acylesterase/phospholipase RssA
MGKLDGNLLRLARKLSVLQGVKPAETVVPRAVASAFRDLASVKALSEVVLRRDAAAAEQFIGLIGGRRPVAPGSRRKARSLSPRAAVLFAQAQQGPIEGSVCPGQLAGDVSILQAGFLLDAVAGYPDARLTARAASYIGARRDIIGSFETRVDNQLWGAGGSLINPSSRPLHVDGGDPLDGGPLTGPNSTGLVPPGSDDPGLGDPIEPPPATQDLCQELDDLCAQLFQDLAGAAMVEADSQLLATVLPNCLCSGAFDDNTVFTAEPDGAHQFPAAQGDYHLIFRGQDITGRIIDWRPQAIRFTIPAGSATGYVWLRRLENTMSGVLSTVLSNLCGIPTVGGKGLPISPSPRALISIMREPVTDFFRINGQDNDLVTEACSALRIEWSVHPKDQSAGELLPPCCSIRVDILDDNGDVLHGSNDGAGSWLHNPQADTSYRLRAVSTAGEAQCGQANAGPILVTREHRLYIEPSTPSAALIVAGRTGTLRVRLSCPAPDEGAQVRLVASDPAILRLPDSALVFPGETFAIVQFGTRRDAPGNVHLTAQLAGHRDGELDYQVLQNLTAIVLSGGGAKGSFELGALLYLREIWNDVEPRVVCGSSVGAINALAVAEAQDGSSVAKLEQIWLGLQYPQDMYVLSPEFQNVADNLGISIPDVILHGGSLPFDSVTSFLEWVVSLGVDGGTVGWAAVGFALGGPVGALTAGLIDLFSNDSDKLSRAIQGVKSASYAFDLRPTQALIENNISSQRIANSGMKLRLAVVALQDGGLYYVTETAHLMGNRAEGASFDEPLTNAHVLPPPTLAIDPAALVYPGFVRDPLIAGTMASAAFPGIFQIRPLFTTNTYQHYMDGGVRQVLPMQAAVELGAQLIFAVAASPSKTTYAPFVYPSLGIPDWATDQDYGVGALVSYGGSDYQCLVAHRSQQGLEPPKVPGVWRPVANATLLPIVRRAIDLQGNELDLAIESPRGGFCDQVERVLIQPAFEVHDTTQIDPGLIRINIAYGYFRAFEAEQFRRGNINALQFLISALATDDLMGTRLLCHQIESGTKISSPAAGQLLGLTLNIQNPGTGGLFDHDALQEVRNLKNHIADQIVQRFRTFGVATFPPTLRDPGMGNQSALDWARTWEFHPDPLRSFLARVDLWAPQQLDYGQVSDDPSVPPAPGRRERDIVEPYPIPADVRNALMAR